ncbi:restriction endonuclease subunit S [Fibrobacter sp.]|uniref:restriction endonuclease subunit S n=1 Tax=Fibrobacter sp. TaxID=35828 RepID=UPI00386A1C94
MAWERKTLDQLGMVSRGRSKHRPRDDESLYGGIYPFIQTADVKRSNFYITEYSQTYNERGLAQSKLWRAGTLCFTIAANIADSAILGIDACFPDSIMGFIPYEGVSDVRFVKYCFDVLQQQCKQISQGATQDNLSWEKLSTIKFPAPDYKTQQKIADILSAYDNLIENNQKQIKLLEEAAQRLYKQWFIDLRYPGHETTPIVDGIPEGWRKDRADSFFNITIGKTPPRAEKQWFTEDGNGIPWISISDMGTDSAFLFETSEGLTLEAIKRHNVKVVPANTVLLSFKLTVGRVSITTTEMCTNEAIAHFVTDDDSIREYAYCYLKNFHYDELGSTSSISKAINSKIVKAMPFVTPDCDLLKKFHFLAKPIFDEMFTKQKQIINLIQSRDRLLPKLMNGELEVS